MERTLTLPATEVPVLGEFDVVVCGGGPAGCAAVIAAARHGAKTLLIEKDGYLGGGHGLAARLRHPQHEWCGFPGHLARLCARLAAARGDQ